MQYRYDAGVFYAPANGGYQVVAPPFGAIVPGYPPDAVSMQVGGDVYYYFGGTFYAPVENGYQVQAGNITYLQYNGDYYQPIEFNGQPAYEVVNMEQ